MFYLFKYWIPIKYSVVLRQTIHLFKLIHWFFKEFCSISDGDSPSKQISVRVFLMRRGFSKHWKALLNLGDLFQWDTNIDSTYLFTAKFI